MARKQVITTTQSGMSPSQPGMNVSVTSGMGKHVLNVSRHYNHLLNEFGGYGVSKRCDCDKMEFPSSEAAFAFALDRGYCRVWNRREMIHPRRAWDPRVRLDRTTHDQPQPRQSS